MPRYPKNALAVLAILSVLSLGISAGSATVEKSECRLRVGVQFPAERSKTPLDGRMLLLVSADGSAEPRYQISDGPNTQMAFGLDVEGLKP